DMATDGHSISDRVRLSNRILDVRTPSTQAILRVQSAVCRTFRRYLDDCGFLGIHTPKLQGGGTEGGADVFKLDYFRRPAFLAQSPQFAKQMCISADFPRIFEAGPVFRAENSNTPRHMTGSTGLDLEMAIDRYYHEAINDIDTLKHHFPHDDLVWRDETARLTFAEGVKLPNESGWTDDDASQQYEHNDLPTRAERRPGELVKEKYHTDYYILDKFPVAARPFYTMPDPKDDNVTNSFDFMARGQEILSGGQRIHEHALLKERMENLGMNPDGLKEYVQAFEWVAPPHAGAGIGLERLVALILDLGNLRHASLFPRDPKSFPTTKEPNLRHPGDTTLQRPKGYLQPLAQPSPTSPRTTGQSLPEIRSAKTSQLEDVVIAFLTWLRRKTRLWPFFILVDKEVEEVLGDKLGWKSFTNVAEQRANLANNEHLTINSDVDRKIRHASKEAVKVTEYGSDV
ncbi:uncharacterized protein A1O5_13423, partial [Cladophialophora psammophila CBS 110553]